MLEKLKFQDIKKEVDSETEQLIEKFENLEIVTRRRSLSQDCDEAARKFDRGIFKEESVQYSFSVIAAISTRRVEAVQIIEGTTDSVVFENFIYKMLNNLRSQEATKKREIALILDNVSFHKNHRVLSTIEAFKATVLFNAEYSPELNPIEQYFNHMKRSTARG